MRVVVLGGSGGLAALRRIGLPFPVARWAVSLNRLAGIFDAGAGEKGGMRVSVVGDRTGGGGRVRRTWQLTAPAMDGPEIPCMAANLLARRLARGEVFKSGAFPCIGFLTLSDGCGSRRPAASKAPKDLPWRNWPSTRGCVPTDGASGFA
jgi:hypothetical protein